MTRDFHWGIRPQPKPKGTRREGQRQRRRELERIDRLENEKVHERSGGRCEGFHYIFGRSVRRCFLRATQVHHFLGGNGVRGRHESALARNKIHVCLECHDWLEQHPAGVRFDKTNAFATLEVLH